LITTLTVPAARLGPSSRLLLELPAGRGGGPHAFTGAQLAFAVATTDRDCRAFIECHGHSDGTWGMRLSYLPPKNPDPAEAKAWAEAVEWLSYRGLCTPMADGAVLIDKRPAA
jgi:hypothetical protein